MSKIALRLDYSVEADVGREFAWRYRTDIANWNDPPATFVLNGPFEAGSRGFTQLPGQDPLHWYIAQVRPCRSFVTEMQLDGAILTFEWCFDGLPGNRTKLTQHITLSGDNAGAYAAQVEAGFGPNLPDGMKRIAAEMVTAERLAKEAG